MLQRKVGEVYYNFRSVLGQRAIWKNQQMFGDDQLPSVGCHAGLDQWHAPDGRVIWIFSHPSPQGKVSRKSARQNLVIRMSDDEGGSWSNPVVVHELAAAYSDVAVTTDGTLCVVFESGDTIGQPYQRIQVARIPMDRAVLLANLHPDPKKGAN